MERREGGISMRRCRRTKADTKDEYFFKQRDKGGAREGEEEDEEENEEEEERVCFFLNEEYISHLTGRALLLRSCWRCSL